MTEYNVEEGTILIPLRAERRRSLSVGGLETTVFINYKKPNSTHPCDQFQLVRSGVL